MKRVFIAFICSTFLTILFAGCGLTTKVTSKIAGTVISKGADFDESIMNIFKEQVPRYMKAWPTFSGLFRGCLTKGDMEKLKVDHPEVVKVWTELDDLAKKPETELTDERRAYWFARKFTIFLAPVVLEIIEARVPSALIGTDMLELINLFRRG